MTNFRSDVIRLIGERPNSRSPAHRRDEFPVGYSSADCSPAGSASASPTVVHSALIWSRRSILFHRATRILRQDGQYLRPVTPENIVQAVARMVECPDYGAIHTQILAIYAVYRIPADLSARYKTADSATRQGLDQVFALWQSFAKDQRELLRKRVRRLG